MKIIIPMAGMGTRMRPHTLITPKPLLSIAGKTIVERIIEFIKDSIKKDISELHFITGLFGDTIEEKLKSIAVQHGCEGFIHYQKIAKGTAHAILCAGNALSDEILVVFADTMFQGKIDIDTYDEAIIWTSIVKNPEHYGVVVENEDHFIEKFIEKPKDRISDKAIIGIYYFKRGETLKKAIEALISEDRNVNGEFQLTDALQDLYNKGTRFTCKIIENWLDCGNKENFLSSTRSILELKKLKSKRNTEGNTFHEPVFIGRDCLINNSVIGPYASIEEKTRIDDSKIENSNIGRNSVILNSRLRNSLVGNHTKISNAIGCLNVGDYSEYEGN